MTCPNFFSAPLTAHFPATRHKRHGMGLGALRKARHTPATGSATNFGRLHVAATLSATRFSRNAGTRMEWGLWRVAAVAANTSLFEERESEVTP
jgi:hypothetical protein